MGCCTPFARTAGTETRQKYACVWSTLKFTFQAKKKKKKKKKKFHGCSLYKLIDPTQEKHVNFTKDYNLAKQK
eukprot:NODE_480_length_3002_cov_23.749217.p8 GENE.NODE_480_length_3002_cov_23.749217~~NODE_480_length_3002_cov_23.749217.p8  ORF type:complete len:73 (-),score=11.69 NODE_480_length_3002_cov_23.749217:26-244(-)